MHKSALLFAALLLVAALAPGAMAQEYKIVLKDSGRVASGRFVSEDDTSVVIEIGGMETRFRKSRLDLAKMKELNGAQPGKAAQPGSAAEAPGNGPHTPYEPYDIYKRPDMQAALKDQVRSFRNEVGRLNGVIAEWQAKAPYPKKERDIESFKRTLHDKEWELEGYELELGESQDPVGTRLYAHMVESERAAAREHREFFEASDRKAPAAELERRSKEIVRLARQATEAREAFSRYREERKQYK